MKLTSAMSSPDTRVLTISLSVKIPFQDGGDFLIKSKDSLSNITKSYGARDGL